jgi:heme/copper-type cytochrome/quinol oxidase subunit 2
MTTPITDRIVDRTRRLLLAAAIGLIVCGPLAAQCAMCRESAGYQRQEAIDSLKRGILVLAIPPAAIVVGIACLTYRCRGTPADPDDRRPSVDGE